MQGATAMPAVKQIRAKFIQIDKLRHTAVPLKDFKRHGIEGELVVPTWDENGYPIWDAPIEMVRHYITVRNGTRYKLFKSDPVQCPVTKPDGSIVWEMYYSWAYKRRSVMEQDPENAGQMKPVWKDFWYETRDGEVKRAEQESVEAVVEERPKPEPQAPTTPTRTVKEDPPPAPEPKQEAEVEHPEPQQPKSLVQVQREKRQEAIDLLGEDAVKAAEKRFRSRVKKKFGAYSKKQHFMFLDMLDNEMEKAGTPG
jgi:hypothetical protein